MKKPLTKKLEIPLYYASGRHVCRTMVYKEMCPFLVISGYNDIYTCRWTGDDLHYRGDIRVAPSAGCPLGEEDEP